MTVLWFAAKPARKFCAITRTSGKRSRTASAGYVTLVTRTATRSERTLKRGEKRVLALLGLPTLGKVGIKQSTGSKPRAVDWVMAAAMLVRREALDEVGLFDEGFFVYSEEIDLCLRLRRAGWEVHYLPEVTVVHHESQFSADVPERRINELWRSRHRYWHKHHSNAGARLAALATGAQYALRAAAAGTLRRDAAFRARMRLHARDSWRVDGPGLRELADERNRRVGAASS